MCVLSTVKATGAKAETDVARRAAETNLIIILNGVVCISSTWTVQKVEMAVDGETEGDLRDLLLVPSSATRILVDRWNLDAQGDEKDDG